MHVLQTGSSDEGPLTRKTSLSRSHVHACLTHAKGIGPMSWGAATMTICLKQFSAGTALTASDIHSWRYAGLFLCGCLQKPTVRATQYNEVVKTAKPREDTELPD